MENTLSILKAFCRWDFVDRNCKQALSLLTKDIHWFGTSDYEDVHSIEEAEAYLLSEIKATPSPYQMTITQEEYVPTSACTGVAFLRLVVENQGVVLSVRATAASRMEDGKEKLCSMHLSVADAAQQADEYYPITKHKEEIAKTKRDLVVSTMPGGLMGVYLQKDFPFYFVNQRMLDYLGYADEHEFVADIDGLISNIIHPDDRSFVYENTVKQLSQGERYSVDYRMKKKDGSYIWVHDAGQKTLDENGQAIIISACYDITPEHEKQAQLDNLMNAMPGGVALYQLVDGKFHVIYHSQGVSALSGHTPEEFEALEADTAVCPEDALAVAEALRKAAATDEVVSLDYRISHADGGFVWISASYQRTGTKDGCPIVHAVFTEMPQQRKLLNSLTEYSTTGIVVSDNKTHELLYINSAVRKLLNIQDPHYAGKTCYEYLVGGNAPCPFCKQRAIGEDDETVNETYLPSLDKYIMSQGRVVKWAGREAHVEYLTDITAGKKVQEQLNNVVHNVPGGICLYRWDGVQVSPLVVSEQFPEMFGIDAKAHLERISGENFERIHPDDLREAKLAAQNALTKAGNSEHTCRLLNAKTNTYHWVYVQGNTVPQQDGTSLVYVTYTDITKERLTAQKLRASERALDAATEQTALWYWFFDPSSGQAYFSPKCTRDFDLPTVLPNYPAAWLQMGFILPEYQVKYSEAVAQASQKNAQAVIEAQAKFKDGSIHWAEFRFTNLPDEDGKNGIVVSTASLIDEKKALLAKYELEKQKPSLGEKTLLLHATFDLETGETVEYEYHNALQDEKMKCRTLQEAIGMVAHSIADEKDKQRFLELNNIGYLKAQLAQGNINFSMDYRRKIPTGQIIWVRSIIHLVLEPDAGAMLLFEYCYDIHAQKMADEVLRMVTTYDYERIASVNYKIGKMMNYGASDDLPAEVLLDYEDVRQTYAKDFVPPEGRAQFLQSTAPETVMKNVLQAGCWEFTTKITQPDGTSGIVKSRFVPYDLENSICILTRTNVTSILEEEEEKNRQLVEALTIAKQANSAKSDFLSAMSHDIRTPMNAIVGMCELALEDETDQNQVHESLETIRSSSQLLLSLINSILDMSRIESGKMVLANEPFSLTGQIHETIAGYKVLAEKKQLNFAFDIQVAHDACRGDIARIHSAIDNILSNAIKYTPAGGTVTYRVSEQDSNKAGIGLYRFEISDTGVGISPDKQKRLFEPFYRGEADLTANIEGTGLGLPIAKAIIDLKGGTISVKSAEGEGTTFVVEIPLHLAEAKEIAKDSKDSANFHAYDLTNVNILLCEDHPINQKVMQRILEKAHATVTVAENGQAGYQAFLDSADNPFDVILMDIQMPKMNGYEATIAIRESKHPQAKTIPIIALSANAFTEDVQKSMRMGMNAHLAKPLAPKTLFDTLSRFLFAKPDSSGLKKDGK